MALRHIGLQLDESLIERIEVARGDVPRQRWVARVLEAALETSGPSSAGREAELEVASKPGRPAATSPQGASAASPRASKSDAELLREYQEEVLAQNRR